MLGSSEGAGGSFGPMRETPPFSPFIARSGPRVPPPLSALSSGVGGGIRKQGRLTEFAGEEPPLSAVAGGSESRSRIGTQYASLCPKVDCPFDRRPQASLLCQYKTGNLGERLSGLEGDASVREWIISEHKISNSLTGIVDDFSGQGMFLFAGETDRRTDVFVLSSSEFEVDSECRLDFFVHMAGSQGRLRVCLNDALNECLYQRSGNQLTTDSRKWNNAFVPLKPGKYTVHFVADRLRKNYVIGLDQIQLLNQYGTAAAACA